MKSSAVKPIVAVIMGSQSDWETLSPAAEILKKLAIPFEAEVVSAHRTPHKMVRFTEGAAARGIQVIIAGAGGAAHLPGMVASLTCLPVLGVPVESRALKGLDSLLSIAQMPAGIPVHTFAVGKSGAINAALGAAAIVALSNPKVAKLLQAFRQQQTRAVLDQPYPGKKSKKKR